MDIAVVGAGLAGALLTQGLRQAGLPATLFEREPADRHSQGYRIHLEPEGDLALRECLPPELYERVLATAGVRGSGVRVLDPQLRVVHEMLVPDPPDVERTGRHLTVDRQTLRRIMLSGIDVHYGAAFSGYELLDDGRVRVRFSDGTVTEADLLVGADGTHSRVRAYLLPDAEVIETGQSEIFGKTPLTDEVRALTPAAAMDSFTTVVGDDGRFVPLAAHRFRSGGEDYVMWVVVAPKPMFPIDLTRADGRTLLEVAAKMVADWHPNIAAVIGLGDPASVAATTIRTANPVPHWETGPVTLAGDAIHTMIPAGISAAVALKDAARLCRAITRRTGSLREAVRAYEIDMLDYGFAAVAASRNRGSS
ncbi:FAD-dependent oxidoreductase [Nocardia spumae]|uniref:FAD-dependent oxidoreductase n=1 Tax=Nocardia spumae TaxID=2887190 RepID=UPI001D13EB3D|nr:NAD(P)/FAD-dependent oxidoreductase [Nocardia spumae]